MLLEQSCPPLLLKHNYDIMDRKLLMVKMAVQEWQHWLEGTKHPFVMLTDHKNPECLRSAKNPCQACWFLFF